MTNYYFTIGLTYGVIGFGVALVFYFLINRNIIGNFWGAVIVALIGSFMGGLFEYLFKDVLENLANFNNSVNLFPPLITAFILVAVFTRVSPKKQKREE